jgi:hypothetical protein
LRAAEDVFLHWLSHVTLSLRNDGSLVLSRFTWNPTVPSFG